MRTADELMRGDRVFCRACKKGDHLYCTMSVHCECTHLEDGDARTLEEFDAYWARIYKEEDEDDETL